MLVLGGRSSADLAGGAVLLGIMAASRVGQKPLGQAWPGAMGGSGALGGGDALPERLLASCISRLLQTLEHLTQNA